jgi:SLOG family YspA-like protein
MITPTPDRVLVTGSRDWGDRAAIDDALTALAAANTFHNRITVIVHGACPTGADAIADDWARWHSARSELIQVERHPADWRAHGQAAGPRRNAEMVRLGADLCLAFIRNGPPGATHTAGLAEAAGIPTRRFTA